MSHHPVTSRVLQDGFSVFLTPIAPLASLLVPDLKISPLRRPRKVTEGPRPIFILTLSRRILAASLHLLSSFGRVSKGSPSS